ncbi:MAG: CsgG/HfaB family protein, partial [Stenotrophomonas sp.]
MSNSNQRPTVWAAAVLAVAVTTFSAPSQAFISNLTNLLGGKCQGNAGSLRIVEPDDGMGAWATYGLPAPTRMLRVMVNDSKCFTVLDRGVGFAAAQAERELASDGHLRADQNLGAGQMRGADYVLIPDIVSQNANAGGMNVGGSASTPQKRGLMGGLLNVATLGVSGKLSTQKQTAEVVLTLVDVRTSEQVVSVSGEAKITDKAWAAAVAASNVQGQARLNAGSWENTEIGQVIKEAYEEAFSRMVSQINRRGGGLQTEPAPQAVVASAAPVPVAAPAPVMPAV